MTAPPKQHPEPPPAAAAPDVIILPPSDTSPAFRPRSGSQKRQRQHVEQFRTDDAEHAELQRRAWADGRLSVGAFCRKRTLGDPGVRHARGPAPPDVRLLARQLSEFNRIGGNLNQAVRALNELRLIAQEIGVDRLTRIAGDAIERNRTAIEELRAALRAFDDREG